jgi:hypothetical protein
LKSAPQVFKKNCEAQHEFDKKLFVCSSQKKKSGSKKLNSKSPLPPPSPENVSDLEQDAINTYYAVRMESGKNGSSMINDGKERTSQCRFVSKQRF